MPSVVELPATGLYVGAVAADVPDVEQRYHMPLSTGGFRIAVFVKVVDRATLGNAVIAVAIPPKPVSVPDWLMRGIPAVTSNDHAIYSISPVPQNVPHGYGSNTTPMPSATIWKALSGIASQVA